MPGGRPPKPVEVHRRNGNPSRKNLPVPVTVLRPVRNGTPAPPPELGQRGQDFWLAVWQAGSAWLSPGLDQPMVEEVCRITDEVTGHLDDITDHGRLIEEPIATASGDVVGTRLVSNPALMNLRRAEESRRRGLIELGFTPTARARLGLAQVVIATQASKLEALIAARERKTAAR